jgi:hypothetical protein
VGIITETYRREYYRSTRPGGFNPELAKAARDANEAYLENPTPDNHERRWQAERDLSNQWFKDVGTFPP